jgi:hypothetical protein
VDFSGKDGRLEASTLLTLVNEKSQVTQDRLYSEERKKGSASRNMKAVTGQQKNIEKQRQQKSRKKFHAPSLGLLNGEGKLKT